MSGEVELSAVNRQAAVSWTMRFHLSLDSGRRLSRTKNTTFMQQQDTAPLIGPDFFSWIDPWLGIGDGDTGSDDTGDWFDDFSNSGGPRRFTQNMNFDVREVIGRGRELAAQGIEHGGTCLGRMNQGAAAGSG